MSRSCSWLSDSDTSIGLPEQIAVHLGQADGTEILDAADGAAQAVGQVVEVALDVAVFRAQVDAHGRARGEAVGRQLELGRADAIAAVALADAA